MRRRIYAVFLRRGDKIRIEGVLYDAFLITPSSDRQRVIVQLGNPDVYRDMRQMVYDVQEIVEIEG